MAEVGPAYEVRRAVRPARAAAAGTRVVVALSGGADSLALLAAAVAEAPSAGVGVAAVVVDHGLQEGSDAVADRAADLAAELGAAPIAVVRVEVGTHGGPEAAARSARYAALGEAARAHGVDRVLLGHTLDDQVETVLMRLARGSGARSLGGMRPESVRHGITFVRPLLETSRATTEAACAELGLVPWVDPHNADPAFTRVRVRHQLLPVLAEVLGDGAVAALARSADLLRDDADALDDWAVRVHVLAQRKDEPVGLDVEVLESLPAAVRRRVLRRAALDAGAPAGSLTASHLQSVDSLLTDWKGQGAVALPGPVSAGRSYGRLTFRGR